MSNYIKQNTVTMKFKTGESWVILSPIEQSIKAKIEAVGTPLKDWDIQINYGIKTGLNEAFIIDGAKRDELIKKDPKSAEIIRPILRGKDIKRNKITFADKYVLYVPWHFPLTNRSDIKGASTEAERLFEKEYPFVYKHLLSFKDKLSCRNQDEVGKRYEWYALQRYGANYMDDFNKQKIVYPETTQGAYFTIDNDGYFVDKTCFIMVGRNLDYLRSTLASQLFEYAYKNIFSSVELNGGTGYQYNKHAFILLPVKHTIEDKALSDEEVFRIYGLTDEEIQFISSSVSISF